MAKKDVNIYEVEDDDLETGKSLIKNKSLLRLFLLNSFVSLVLGGMLLCFIIRLFPQLLNIDFNVTKLEKEVTVTDMGIADAVDKVKSSVVSVYNYDNDTLLDTGTGFIYRYLKNKYYIVTNYHVVENGTQIKVDFIDESSAVVSLVAGDKFTDIAVLVIETNNAYDVVEMGSNLKTRVGDTVFVVGSPVDAEIYAWSVSRGIISGKDREVSVSVDNTLTNDWKMQLLQTDAAINSGNSGGPLCNSNGEVIGIINRKMNSSNIEGISFAIPIEIVESYVDAVINGEDLRRPYMGVYLKENTAGVLISSVEKGSPAEDAGLKAKDVILKIEGNEIENIADLRYVLYKYKAGNVIEVEFRRNGIDKTTNIKLGINKEY